MSDKKIKKILLVSSFVILGLLLGVHVYEAKITPFFQGPDEIVHVANSFYGFDQVMGSKPRCGDVTYEMYSMSRTLLKLPFHSYNKVTADDVNKLKIIGEKVIAPESTVKKQFVSGDACGYLNLVNKYFFNIFTIPKALVKGSITNTEYLYLLRLGSIFFAFLIYSLSVFIIMKGKFIFKGLISVNEDLLRAGMLLCLLMYMGIPQNVFMTSVINQEAYLVPFGALLFISLLFRIKGLSELMILSSIYVFSFKPVYLPYVLFVVTFYVAYYLRNKINLYKSISFISIMAFLIVLIAPFLMKFVYLKTGVSFLSDKMFFMNDLWHYYSNIGMNMSDVFTQRLLHVPSFFGNFGWLDAKMPNGAFWSYLAIFLALFIVLIINLYRYWPKVKCFKEFISKTSTYNKISAIFIFICLPVISAFVLYVTYEALYVWCLGKFDSAVWSCGVQGRYFLPIYFYTFAYPFIIAFLGPILVLKNNDKLTNALLLFITVLLLVAVIHNIDLSTSTLINRYYESREVMHQYLLLI
jgi:hypothetical protein